MQTNRFDYIAAELARLSSEIEAINQQPFDTRLDLRSTTTETETTGRAALARLQRSLRTN